MTTHIRCGKCGKKLGIIESMKLKDGVSICIMDSTCVDKIQRQLMELKELRVKIKELKGAMNQNETSGDMPDFLKGLFKG